FGLIPAAALIAVVVWLMTFATTRYVSVASMMAALALPVTVVAMLYLKQLSGPALLLFSICLAAIVIWRHRSNLSRLMSGTKPRFERKRNWKRRKFWGRVPGAQRYLCFGRRSAATFCSGETIPRVWSAFDK